jgi:hypothetical protein
MEMKALLLLLVSATAIAKPLPDGLKISIEKEHLVATRDGMTVTLYASRKPVDKIESATLSEDGTIVEVKLRICGLDPEPEPDHYPLDQINAQLENALGMRAHLAKKYNEAIPHFAKAASLWSATPVYATNLASAQARAGKLDDADKTIATYEPPNQIWWVWRLAVDPDLAPLRKRPSANIGASKRGTAKSLGEDIAYNGLGLVAVEQHVQLYNGIPDGSAHIELVILDVGSGKELFRLPTDENCGVADMETQKQDPACVKRVNAANAEHRKAATELLQTLGFNVLPRALVPWRLSDGKKEFKSTDQRKIVFGDKVMFVNGKNQKELQLNDTVGLAFVPGGLVELYKGGKEIDCSEDGPFKIDVTSYANP